MRSRLKWERLKAAILRHTDVSAAWLGGQSPKYTNLLHFPAAYRKKKENPETSAPGFKKPRNEIQTYFVTFGVKAVSLVSKGL